ncbi:MAG TPA: guanylate kinase [Anaerolineaceae bacterium]
MLEPAISFDLLHPIPHLYVISGPSGAGKDAVLNELRKRDLPFHYLVTTTSRLPRPGEREGIDYNFISREEFKKRIARDEFVEYALVYEDYKGIPRAQIEQALASGKDVFMRIDVQGARTIRSKFRNTVLIFLVPENEEEWLDRFRKRKADSPEQLKIRIETARKELEYLPEFDYIVVNRHDQLEDAADTILAIHQAETHAIHKQRLAQ